MAFLPLFTGKAYLRRSGNPYKTITLMEYENRISNPLGCPARKFCYIIKRGDLQKVFTNAGVILPAVKPHNTHSYWNRWQSNEDNEYGVEICEDDNGDPVKSHRLRQIILIKN